MDILEEDFTRLAAEYDFSVLRGACVLVTGATGFVGSQLLWFLDFLNRTQGYKMRLVAFARNADRAAAVFGETAKNGHIQFVYGDILFLPEISDRIDFIIHGASITSSKYFITHAVETIDTAINGTLNMLHLAHRKGVKSFVYLSSMEAFGVTDGRGEVREENLGYIDIANPRSSYMESKRMCENLCVCFAVEYGLNVKSVRLAQTLGPRIAYGDSRVAAQFARAVIEEHDIVLKTEGLTKRPVLYSADAVSAIITVLLRGVSGQTYTAANPETFATIRETAEMVAQRIAGGKIKISYDIQKIPMEYAPNFNLNLNIDKLNALGWQPAVGLEEMYRRMIMGMRQ
ncbi:MAG: NAD(P)-dependent oxidoreductase [Bacteroides sp.]|nr:NAD(P)-dependent oxidoreductase [Prevotella sp.]MCM1407874.1 NAD(P)-dependent oxidoreductase [Treponema brennaborense]MCM1469616.1 NAD(P)-dependent oxidoreductase [Bacteroides sp.]